MKEGTVIILIVGAVAVLFWAVSTGLIKTTGGNIQLGGGIVAPQPSSNYSGYLAASTASGVSSALNGLLSGFGNMASGWFSPSGSGGGTTVQGQVAVPTSPALSAQPSGPNVATPSTYASYDTSLVGPQISSDVSYDATSGAAFDYYGLSDSNSYDPEYSLS